MDWKSAVVLLFVKPGKDPSSAGSYRPFALTSNLCKSMTKMLVGRLMFCLESRGLVRTCQSRFRRGHSTLDTLVVRVVDLF